MEPGQSSRPDHPAGPTGGKPGPRISHKPGTVAFVVGLVMLLMGVRFYFGVNGMDPDAPTCGDDVMRPGDRCLAYGSGGGTYQEKLAEHQRNYTIGLWLRNVGLAGGPILVVVGVLLWINAFRRVARPKGPDATLERA